MSSTGDVDVDEILAKITPRIVKVRVLLPQDLLTRHDELERKLEVERQTDERENRNPVAPEISRQIRALEAEIETSKDEFSFISIGRAAWVTLVAKYPPTKEQLKLNRGLAFDPIRLPVAAIAASSHKPKLTLDQAKVFEENLPDAEFDRLWGAACSANVGGNDSPKSMAAGLILRLSGASETIAAPEGSLAASS